MKKLVALLNIIFGSLNLFLGSFFALVIIPRAIEINQSIKTQLNTNTGEMYVFPTIIIILAVFNIITGLGILNIVPIFNKKHTYKLGIVALILLFLLQGLVIGNMVVSTISPVYNLTETLDK